MIEINQIIDELSVSSKADDAHCVKELMSWEKEKQGDQDAIMEIAIIAGLLFNTAYCEIQNSVRHQEDTLIQWDTVLSMCTVGVYIIAMLFALRKWFQIRKIQKTSMVPITGLLGLGMVSNAALVAFELYNEFGIWRCSVITILIVGGISVLYWRLDAPHTCTTCKPKKEIV